MFIGTPCIKNGEKNLLCPMWGVIIEDNIPDDNVNIIHVQGYPLRMRLQNTVFFPYITMPCNHNLLSFFAWALKKQLKDFFKAKDLIWKDFPKTFRIYFLQDFISCDLISWDFFGSPYYLKKSQKFKTQDFISSDILS